MDNLEFAAFKEYTGRTLAPTKPAQEAFAIVGRRGGKSYISAVVACYLALFHDWRPYLSKGETGWVLCIAADRTQARNMLGYISGILGLPMFRKQVKTEKSEEILLKNQIGIRVATSDFRTPARLHVRCGHCRRVGLLEKRGRKPCGGDPDGATPCACDNSRLPAAGYQLSVLEKWASLRFFPAKVGARTTKKCLSGKPPLRL